MILSDYRPRKPRELELRFHCTVVRLLPVYTLCAVLVITAVFSLFPEWIGLPWAITILLLADLMLFAFYRLEGERIVILRHLASTKSELTPPSPDRDDLPHAPWKTLGAGNQRVHQALFLSVEAISWLAPWTLLKGQEEAYCFILPVILSAVYTRQLSWFSRIR